MTAHRIYTNAHPMRDTLPLFPMAQTDAQFWARRNHRPVPMRDWLNRKRPLWKRILSRGAGR